MGQTFELVNDSREISEIVAMRVMVSSALLYTFTVPVFIWRRTMYFWELHTFSGKMSNGSQFLIWAGA